MLEVIIIEIISTVQYDIEGKYFALAHHTQMVKNTLAKKEFSDTKQFLILI